MPFDFPIDQARAEFPEYKFVGALTPSAHKAAFHVVDAEGNELCLKIISPRYCVRRLHREIEAMQSLDHPNIVKLIEYTYSTGQRTQRHYLIEEFVSGDDLADLLTPGTSWDIKRTSDFFAQLCDGLSALRKVSIVHRDLKPHNIRVRPDGTPVIIDFGLARLLLQPDLTNTVDGAQIGTPKYFAPEQFDGNKHDIEHRTDLFALGTLLYEAVVGIHPFHSDGMSVEELRKAVCEGSGHLANSRFKSLPNGLQVLMARLLDKERSKRPHDAGQVATMLREIGGA